MRPYTKTVCIALFTVHESALGASVALGHLFHGLAPVANMNFARVKKADAPRASPLRYDFRSPRSGVGMYIHIRHRIVRPGRSR